MEKISKLLLIIFFPVLTLAHGHYKNLMMSSTVNILEKVYSMELIIGKSEGKD